MVEWARPYGVEFGRLWSECPRGDWLLAIAARLGVEAPQLARAAAACARLSLAHLPEEDRRPAEALGALEAFARGALDRDACGAHRSILAEALEGCADAAAGAALVAVQAAAETPFDREAAANAAAFAAQAAVIGAGDCAMLEALRFTQRKSAQLVRQAIAAEQVEQLFRDAGDAAPSE